VLQSQAVGLLAQSGMKRPWALNFAKLTCPRPLESSMPTAKQLCDQASQLPPDERMALVDQIMDTLDERDESLDAQWTQKAECLLAAYHRGEVQAIPLNEVIAKYQLKTA